MKVTKRKPRCKYVLAIIRNKVEMFEMIREETYPPQRDFADGPMTLAILRFPNTVPHRKFAPEIGVGIDNVIFLP